MLHSIPQSDCTPSVDAIPWQPSGTASREPVRPVLDHSIWLLARWAPDAQDTLATEAHWLVSELATRLLERDSDARRLRALLVQALAMLHAQSCQLDALQMRAAA
jgi:hypothetical protein